MPRRRISIIIPNWNGKPLLERNLPFLLDALSPYQGKTEVIVVDDGSTDGSVEFLASSYPHIRVLSSSKNEGFAIACNKGVQSSKNEIVYLLNNDIVVSKNFLEPLWPYFEDDDFFAVSSVAGPPNADVSLGALVPTAHVQFKYGIFWYYYKTIINTKKPISVFFSTGGHSAFDKKKFLALGGFDTLYHPFYWEDIDISYRAWKRGWRSLYEPKSRVIHNNQTTIGAGFKKGFIQNIHWRNRFLFTWKNLDDIMLWCRHLSLLPFELALLPVFGYGYFSRGFFMALKKLPGVLKSRKKREKSAWTDKDILDIFKNENKKNYRHEIHTH
jgi:GT2 family glycosyltransferase